jgi:hypothetical protein
MNPFTQELFLPGLIEIGLLVKRRKFLKILSVFLLFRYYIPLVKGILLHLNNLESSLPNGDLCQAWLKLANWCYRSSQNVVKSTDR